MTRLILPASDRALLVEVDDLDAAMRLHAALAREALPGVRELVPAARTVLVRHGRVDRITLARALADVPLAEAAASEAREVVIPVRYDGEDLEEVAGLLGVTPEELIARHSGATWRAAFSGFAPGFAYLIGDDPLFEVPRRATPRTRIPAGAVGLAGAFSGVYPRESPGGWQLIGRTDATLWDLERDPPALVRPGDVVRFVASERAVAAAVAPAPPAPRATGYAIEVVQPGPQLLPQDRGRPGLAALGVSASGAADGRALHDANEAVGNEPGTAVLELLGGGAVLRFRGPGVIALTGAPLDAELVHADGEADAVEPGVPTAVRDGDELVTGWARRGLRATLAVRGGLALEPVLGSLSVDTLAGLGPLGGRPLRAGDVLPLHGPAATRLAVRPHPAPRAPLPAPGDTATLRILLGPRDDWFAPEAVSRLVEESWAVTPRSDRVGVRLAGAHPLERSRTGELASEAVVAGAIQVPADGQPVLFLADHPLTGGYPVIGAVMDADLDLAGQLPPGSRVRFVLVGA